VSRPTRALFLKVGKTIDRIEWDSTQKDLRLAAQASQIEQLRAAKQKKKAIDCNETFASIETIRQAKQAMAALPTTSARTRVPNRTTNTRDASVTNPQDAYMHVFSINETV